MDEIEMMMNHVVNINYLKKVRHDFDQSDDMEILSTLSIHEKLYNVSSIGRGYCEKYLVLKNIYLQYIKMI